MRKFGIVLSKVVAATALVAGVAAPAMAQDWNNRGDSRYEQSRDSNWDRGDRYDRGDRGDRYDRNDDRDNRDYRRGDRELVGPGVVRLSDVLRDTREGRSWVMDYDFNRNGVIDLREGAEANRALIRAADRNGDAHVSAREGRRFFDGDRSFAWRN